jgi:hypothetical protein
MVEFLEAVTQRETSLNSERLYPDCNMARLITLNISWDFDFLGKVIRKRGRFAVDVPSASDRRIADISLTLITSKPKSTNPSEMSSTGVVHRR